MLNEHLTMRQQMVLTSMRRRAMRGPLEPSPKAVTIRVIHSPETTVPDGAAIALQELHVLAMTGATRAVSVGVLV